MSFAFGIFDSFDSGVVSPGQLLRDRLDFAVEAERLGIEHYHVTEHHGTPLSVCPSPNLFLAALSQRTSRIRLGALVYVLPAYQPVRLAEEIATLDQLTEGRIDLGVGSGISPYELEYFGIDGARGKEVYEEMLPVVLAGLASGTLRQTGPDGTTHDVTLSISPLQSPYPPVWYASSNTLSAQWAGANAINFVGRWGNGAFVPAVEQYWSSFADAATHEERINPGNDPRVGLSGSIVIGSSDEEAMDRYLSAYSAFGAGVTHLWHQHDDHRVDPIASAEAGLESGSALVGTAETVRDALIAQLEKANINYYEPMLMFGDMTADEGLQNLRSFCADVVPAVRSAVGRELAGSVTK